jgi:hypothetical protein
MKIMLAGSFAFAKEIVKIKKQLEDMEHTTLTTDDLELYADSPSIKASFDEELKQCIKHDSMRDGFNQVADSDIILVCNYQKNNIQGYLGTSVLMEIAVAYHLNKKVFLLYDYDKSHSYGLEIAIVNPVIIEGDLSNIQ